MSFVRKMNSIRDILLLKMIRPLVVASCVVFLIGCSPNIEKSIVGKWERSAADGTPETDEFQSDGGFRQHVGYGMGESIDGTYRFLNENQIQLISSGGALIGTVEVAISDGGQTLEVVPILGTTKIGKPSKYKKVEEQSSANSAQVAAQAEPKNMADLRQSLSAGNSPDKPQLSAAAEQAITEGFVDIKDPKVKDCTEKKVAEMRKQLGPDAVINFEMYNEAAVACGFNI